MGRGWQLKNLAGFCQLVFLENSWAMFVLRVHAWNVPAVDAFCGKSGISRNVWCGRENSAQDKTLEGGGTGFFNCYYFYSLMKHLNPLGWILWLFPLRHFVTRNFDGSSSCCRRSFKAVFNLLVQFHLYIHRITEMCRLEKTSKFIKSNP